MLSMQGDTSMKPWKNHKVIPIATIILVSGFMSFAYQNCARAKFTIDPAAKSEALGKESVFDRDQGDDGSVPGSRPGDDGAIAGGGSRPGDDGAMPGGTVPGQDPSVPMFPGFPIGNDPRIPIGSMPGMDPMIPGLPTGNDPRVPIGSMPGMDPNIPAGGVTGNDPKMPGGVPTGNDPAVPMTSVPISFTFYCSNWQSDSAGGNVLTAEALKIVIFNQMNQVACELTGDFKSQILNTKKLTFKPCAGLPAGRYDAHIMDVKQPSNSFLTKELTKSDIIFTINSDGSITPFTRTVGLIYDYNSGHSDYAESNIGGTSTSATQALCDTKVSPLIISMNSQARGIQLTSPLDGIQFDILGQNSFPRAHDKKQISWLAVEQQEYYFIVLPNQNGQVLGIDQMFGDNTRGPDGRFAANGYKALAKYDDDNDRLITEEDGVFNSLRLWNDKNRDGIADSSELFRLQEKSLTVIDLRYDNRYKETDQYGNQTLMKSVVKAEDGKLHLLFDLWFRYLNITK